MVVVSFASMRKIVFVFFVIFFPDARESERSRSDLIWRLRGLCLFEDPERAKGILSISME